MNNKTAPKLENKIMSKIKSGHVKLRSKYVFLAEKLGLGSAFALSVVLAVLFFNLFFFYLKTTDNLEYLSFGSDGIFAFLESFPYLLVVSFALFLFLAGYLMTKADFSYKKPFGYFAANLIIFVMVVGGALAYTDIPEKIEEEAFSENAPGAVFKPFLKRAVEPRGRGIAGKISEVGDSYLIIETPFGAQNVNIKSLEPRMIEKFEKEQFVIAIGERKDDVFVARAARIVDEEKLPMIKRGIHRRSKRSINGLPPMPILTPAQGDSLRYNEEAKRCIDDCIKTGEFPEKCFEGCGDK